jgi:hypothetical protein
MNEKELTLLRFVVKALVVNPKQYNELLSIATTRVNNPTREFQEAIRILRDGFSGLKASRVLQQIATLRDSLITSYSSPSAQWVGRALDGALDELYAEDLYR